MLSFLIPRPINTGIAEVSLASSPHMEIGFPASVKAEKKGAWHHKRLGIFYC